ncbi:MAG: transposase [Planctomycetota bacterium]|nr:transposase [Planctomycetota bacterium]MDA0918655.1 transposase [Planctomycetota bacterium]MDA1158311.1 transposase [Planctomycetota bacterium]
MVRRRVYDDGKHIHFVTFSCYRRRKFLEPDHAKRVVIGHLGSKLAGRHGLCLGFVIMPDHVHALVWFPEVRQLSRFMNEWKGQSSSALKELFRKQFPNYLTDIGVSDPIWQARYYGFNIWSRKKAEEKLDYMHMNPVRAGLVNRAVDWRWSSARWYIEHRSVGLPIFWPPGIECDDEFNVD